MLVTTADRRVNVLDGRARILRASHTGLHDAPVLSCTKLGNAILTSSMSGSLHLNNLKGEFISKRRDHSKYVVRVAVLHDEGSETIIATAGWDSKILIYKCKSPFDALNLSEPVSAIPLQTKPEAIVFVRHPDNNQPLLLVSRTDASHIFYYTIEAEPRLLGKQNLAPHSNAWVAFTPSAMELSPTDPTLLAVGTSSVPHMKLLLVRLLFPPLNGEQDLPTPAPSALAALLDGPDAEQRETQASQARAALALAEREAVAIQIHCTTMAPQTAYSTPAVAWRPDGSGVWVNGDDGAVRGVEASTGKVVSTLVGHDPGSKVRCLWAGNVKGREGEGDRELLVSGGFDHKLIVWEVDE
jgi:WD40 repeat protein